MTLDSDLRGSIEALLTENTVVLFMKGNRQTPQCGFSAKTVSALDLLVSDYVTIDVLQYPDIREGIKTYGNWPTIPQLYVKGELIGGSDIVLDMMQSGELADVLDITVPESALPQLHIADAAAEAMRKATESQPTMALHLQINAGWEHEFSLAPEGQGIKVESNGITICLDPWSAARANGLRIELEENLAGTAFNFDNPNAPPPVNQVTVQQLKEKLDDDETILLFDVRSTEEQAKAVIEGARPWNREALEFIQSLPKDVELIFHCHMGGRSQAAAEQCRRMGYTNLHNLKGGIKAWSIEIDSSVPDY